MGRTALQIQVMVAFLFILVGLAIGYSLWDPFRQEDQEEFQVAVAAERGAHLFALNCSVCHAPSGQGVLANAQLFPGLPLSIDANRPDDPLKRDELVRKFTDTIRCGRVGTLMPAWAIDQGGSLSDEQIRQLVTLITTNADNAWEKAEEFWREANDSDQQLAAALAPGDTVVQVTDASVFGADAFIVIDDEHLKITAIATTGAQLASELGQRETQFDVTDASTIDVGALIRLDAELMRVTSVEGKRLTVERGVEGTQREAHRLGTEVFDDNRLVVERGQGTPVQAHDVGATIYNTIAPPTPDQIFRGACGQILAGPGAAPAAEATPDESGVVTIVGKNIAFDFAAVRVKAGQEFTVVFDNQDAGIPHDIAFYTDSGATELLTADSKTAIENGPVTQELTFTAPEQPGEYFYRCDVHPTQMTGTLIVE